MSKKITPRIVKQFYNRVYIHGQDIKDAMKNMGLTWRGSLHELIWGERTVEDARAMDRESRQPYVEDPVDNYW